MAEPALIFTALATAFAAISALVLTRALRRYRSLAVAAVVLERRRLARDLHDGLAQELAFISMEARRLTQHGDEDLDQIAEAAERALGESRELMSTCRSRVTEELGAEIAETAKTFAERHGAKLHLDLNWELRVDPETGEHLVRILREALSNSLVHGRARALSVQLLGGDGLRLRVTDDGIGFEPEANRASEHFGLVSMRERAREIGAELLLRSHPGVGTQLEVVLP